jgi:hypothetical protein
MVVGKVEMDSVRRLREYYAAQIQAQNGFMKSHQYVVGAEARRKDRAEEHVLAVEEEGADGNTTKGCKSGKDQYGQDGSYGHSGSVWIKTSPSPLTTVKGSLNHCLGACLARPSCQGIVRLNTANNEDNNVYCSLYHIGTTLTQTDSLNTYQVRDTTAAFLSTATEDSLRLRLLGLRTNSAGTSSLVTWLPEAPPASLNLLCSTNDYKQGEDYGRMSSTTVASDVPVLSSKSSNPSKSTVAGSASTIQLPRQDHVSPGSFWDATL